MVLGIGFGFVGFSLFRPLNGASGHLARSRKIIHDYNNLFYLHCLHIMKTWRCQIVWLTE